MSQEEAALLWGAARLGHPLLHDPGKHCHLQVSTQQHADSVEDNPAEPCPPLSLWSRWRRRSTPWTRTC